MEGIFGCPFFMPNFTPMETKQITIAIDGHSSCGKSTLAKDIAKKLDYIFVDTGAMYRAVTFYALNSNLLENDVIDEKNLIEQLRHIKLSFKIDSKNGSRAMYLNGKNIDHEIRSPRVSKYVSQIAKIKAVREKLVQEQREMGENGGIVMDGRDIGSVVFPNAELKLFVTADIKTRTDRRHKELTAKGITISREEVEENLISRDETDSNRKESPLIQTEDAIVIDNSNLTVDEQLNLALNIIQRITEEV